MTNNNSFLIRFSEGTGRNLGKATNVVKTLVNFKKIFRTPDRSPERFKEYMKLPDAEQSFLKGRNGWFYRTQIEGKSRNRKSGQPSDLVTMDFDYATPEFFAWLQSGNAMPEWEWFMHTSRRHTPENPRFRLFICLSEELSNEFYNAVSRIMAQYFDPDMTNVDKVSFRPAQMMYKPTASIDSEYVFYENAGELVDWNELLDTYELTTADWRDVTKLPKVPNETLRETADKMEDPEQKEGPVGDFCRAYDIFDAIAEFDLPYDEVVDDGPDRRFSYTLGTTYNGAIAYDDGKYLFSHHGSDPISDMEVNSFDLVRIHKFGDKDDADEMDKTITKRASWKLMIALCQRDPGFKKQQVKSRYDIAAMNEDFADFEEDTTPTKPAKPAPTPKPAKKPREDAHEDEDDFDDIEPVDSPDLAQEPDDRVVGLTAGMSVFDRKRREKPSADCSFPRKRRSSCSGERGRDRFLKGSPPATDLSGRSCPTHLFIT